jgi:predicted phage-related endonuclease
MPITPRQREQRRNHAGGADLYDICCGNARRVHDSKTMPLRPDDAGEAAWIGNVLEPGLLDAGEEWLGPILRNQRRVVKGTPIAINCDGIVKETGEPVEIKTSGVLSRFTPTDEWGDEGTDQIPVPHIFQVHGAMMATQTTQAHVIALIGGRGICRYVVPYNEDLGAHIRDRVRAFWDKHVLPGRPPDSEWSAMCAPTLDVIRRIRREPGSIAPVDAAFVEKYEQIAAVAKWVKECQEAAKLRILDALGTAEASAVLPDGRQVTYLRQTKRSLRTDDLKRDHPDIYAKYSRTTEHPVFRIKKATKGLESDGNGSATGRSLPGVGIPPTG